VPRQAENHQTMPAPAPAVPGLEIPAPLALSVILATIAITIYAVRVLGRRARRHERRRVGGLARQFMQHVAGRLPAADLRRVVSESNEGEFWRALEGMSVRWQRREWLRLSRVLGRNRWSAAERRALRDDSPWRRELAARRLALLASPESRSALRRALVSGPESVSLACAESLARYGDRRTLRWMLRHPATIGRRPRVPLIDLLHSFGTRAVPDLVAALERGIAHPRVERAAAEALGLLGERSARPAIERLLASPSVDARVTACRALGRLAAIESGTTLLRALHDEAWPVRAQAAKALGLARVTIAVPRLAECLTDRSWWVRRHAAYALVRLGSDGQQALRSIAAGSPDPYARDMALEVLEGTRRAA
jgi:HEAT repeat protein